MVWEGLPCENKLRQTGLIVLASILVPTGCVLLGLLTKWIARNEVRDTPSIYPLVCPYKAQKPFLPLLFLLLLLLPLLLLLLLLAAVGPSSGSAGSRTAVAAASGAVGS